MDIRTLLTETKSFPHQKRKLASLSPNPVPFMPPQASLANIQSPTSATDHIPNKDMARTQMKSTGVKRVKFTLNCSTLPDPQSFVLTIHPTDPPNAITSTVKDFFALHSCGVSFTDTNGCILIITPYNLTDDMEVIVNQTSLGDGENKHKKRRKTSLSSRKKGRKLSVEEEILEVEIEEDGSQDMDFHEKKEKILSSDVSVENILDSSRRKLSKFSSESLPLIPQFQSSVGAEITSVFSPSPNRVTQMTVKTTGGYSYGNLPLPTPTPTTASVISDEDAAIQLMRLTDPLATPILSPSVVDEESDHQSVEEDTYSQTNNEQEHSRCTRCITAKKGCDRKRPCSRCVQAGCNETDCTSDDEKGSARKRIAALRRSTMIGRSVGRPRKPSRS